MYIWLGYSPYPRQHVKRECHRRSADQSAYNAESNKCVGKVVHDVPWIKGAAWCNLMHVTQRSAPGRRAGETQHGCALPSVSGPSRTDQCACVLVLLAGYSVQRHSMRLVAALAWCWAFYVARIMSSWSKAHLSVNGSPVQTTRCPLANCAVSRLHN